MKAVEFIFQDTEIHFLLGNEKNVLVNATEMAKAFGKRTDNFLRLETTLQFITALKLPHIVGTLSNDIIDNRGRNGIYFNRLLALKFAAWLDPEFEIWIYTKIEDILFGSYRTHWEAHMRQETAKQEMEKLKGKLLADPTPEDVVSYFELERIVKDAKNAKINAIRHQYRILF